MSVSTFGQRQLLVRTMEEAYLGRGWKKIEGPDGSISFERDAEPSVIADGADTVLPGDPITPPRDEKD
jgi:hypothetical protein